MNVIEFVAWKMADVEYIIKTKYAESFEFVYVKKSELSFENYCVNGKNY